MSTLTPADVKIRGEFTPDPEVCRFTVNQPILEEGWTLVCRSAAEAAGSRLLETVFAGGDVARVSVSGSVLAVTKATADAWPKVAAKLIPRLKEVVAGGGELVSAEAVRRMKEGADEGNMAALITELFETRVNPSLASHGGWVRLVRIVDRDVHVEMGGGCQGCSASKQTLKFGIERSIRDLCPQVREVVDATDHASGENPYYKN
ncbi:MAG: NifU family protein [Kiritimatiellia bacterium]